LTPGETAAIVVAVAVAVGMAGLLLALGSMLRTMKSMRRAVEDVQAEAVPLLSDLRAVIRQANDDLVRVDGLIDRADSISDTVDSASRLVYKTFSNPVVKTAAFVSGSSRAYRRLRRKSG
jgi:uncharacterized protein YoxC